MTTWSEADSRPVSARASRRQVLAAIALAADLPAPCTVSFRGSDAFSVYLDRVADLHTWLPYFGMATKDVSTQPYRHQDGPEKGQTTTLANAYNHDGWRGWTVHLNALDPVGVADPELDDATRDQLRQVADSSAAHRQVAGSVGAPGQCSAECACGTTFDGFDTIAEAAKLLDDHIAAEAGASC